MTLSRRTMRGFALFFLADTLLSIAAPTVSYALTTGPNQTEFTSYEPVGTSDMVNLITGDFTYNVPLIEVPSPEGGFTLPLSYHSGIGLEDEASWAGLGWNVNAGSISRTKVSAADDDYDNVTSINVQDPGGSGYVKNYGVYEKSWDSEKGYGGAINFMDIAGYSWNSSGLKDGTVMGLTFNKDKAEFDAGQFMRGLQSVASIAAGGAGGGGTGSAAGAAAAAPPLDAANLAALTANRRLLPSGALDPAFNLTPLAATGGGLLQCATVSATGAIYVGGTFATYGAVATKAVARLQANGMPDPGFVSGLNVSFAQNTKTLVIQPNGRLLLGGIFYSTAFDAGGMARLFPNGGSDLSFDLTRTPRRSVWAIVVQPDGAIVAGGPFTEVLGLPFYGLVRMNATNVLSVAARQERASFEAWPIPAHEVLHLQLDAAARPRELFLSDAVGRVVLRQPATQAQVVLNTGALVPGVYVLTVRYAAGTVTRRVVVE